jgi:hypothetical protein
MQAVSNLAFPSSMQEQQTGLTPPSCRTPPSQKQDTRQTHPRTGIFAPVLMSTAFSTLQQRFAYARLSDPHLTHNLRLFLIAHHDGLQPTQHEVV